MDTFAWRSALFSDATWREIRDSLRELRAMRYEVAIDFQGAWKSAILAQLSRAPSRIGFQQTREKPATLFYTHQVAARGRHIVEQNLSLAQELCGSGLRPESPGQPSAHDRELDFPLAHDPAAERAVEQLLGEHGLHSFVLVNPGAGWGAKCWPAERYAEVVRALAIHGLRAIVNFGPGEEPLARDVERAANVGAPSLSSPGLRRQDGDVPIAIAMPTAVAELTALCRRARLCIGGDTGPVHLAAALGVPVVALFGPTDPARNGPCSDRAIVLRSQASRTTTSHEINPEEGLLQISAVEVIAAARHLLASEARS